MRVLVVEDDDDLRSAVGASLRGAGIEVDVAVDLPDADLALALTTYDGVVFDRILPSGDALDYVQVRRSAGWTVPVLFLTIRDTVADRITVLRHADDYLVKPFSVAELLARVQSLTRRGAISASPVLVIGNLEIDQENHEVRRDGVLLTLAAKEFDVLELLAVRHGQPVPRADLLTHAWDERTDPMSNVLDVLIARLRRKLGPSAQVQTVRGVGYRLVVNQGLRTVVIPENAVGTVLTKNTVLRAPDGRGELDAGAAFPVTIYLGDESAHPQVQAAVEGLVQAAGAEIIGRDDPLLGSWFRRMRARTRAAATSPLAREAAATAAHALDSRLVLAQDAGVTATMMQNLGPVLAALQPTKDAVIRVGALLIVKVEWTVAVHQLTVAQQLLLDHHPQLLTSPNDILAALHPDTDGATAASTISTGAKVGTMRTRNATTLCVATATTSGPMAPSGAGEVIKPRA